MKRFLIALAVVALAALGAADTWAQRGGGGGGGGRPPGGGSPPSQGAGPSHGGHHGGGYRGHGGSYHGGHYRGHSGHSGWYGGVYLGSPWYWGWPYYGWGWGWGYPYYGSYAYGYPYYEPAPSVYVEQSVTPAEAAPAPPNVWYYCTDPAGYYPYVQKCKVLWVPVKPFGPSAGGEPAPTAPS